MNKGDNYFKFISLGLTVISLFLLSSLSADAATSYFSDDFESGLSNWLVSGSDWALIDTDFVSGTHSVTDSPDSNYPADTNATMELAHTIDLSGATAPVLTYWYKIYDPDCIYNYDHAYVDISEDGGLTWSTLVDITCTNVATWTHVQVDLSAYKTSPIKVRFRLRGDRDGRTGDGWYLDDVEIKELDTLTHLPYPFSDDFESGLSNWLVSGSDWALIDTDFVSGTHSVTDSPDSNYPADTNATMELAHTIDLSGATAPVLTYWYKIYDPDCTYTYDHAYVDISEDGGLTWSTLLDITCTNIATWTRAQIDLSAYKASPIKLRFRLRADGDGRTGDGWYLDDVRITDLICTHPPVIDSFTADPVSGNAPLTVDFNCTAHDDVDSIIEYRWDFDGNGSTDKVTAAGSTQYEYTDNGTHNAVCTAVDHCRTMGVSDPITISIGTYPMPDIKAKGSDGPIKIFSFQKLILTTELDPGSYAGYSADWWILAKTPDWYHYDLWCDCWKPGRFVTYLSPLFNLSTPYEVMNMTLPPGSYTFYFGIDMEMNGWLDMGQIYYDSVDVTVRP